MSSIRRSPLTSIENIEIKSSPEEIELQEVNEPLLPQPIEQNNEAVDETSPFPLNLNDDNEDTQVEFRPVVETETETGVRQRRRRSSPSNRPRSRQNGGIQRFVRDFWADLMPANDRSAWRIPLIFLAIFIIFIIILIIFIVLGYTSVDYDEFGVTHNSLTGVMDLKHPYSVGVYIILPWKKMIKFDKTARYLNFNDLTIFTTDQASIILDATVVYRIRPDQIEPIWLNFADKHERILRLVAENILRNHGNQFSIYDYRARREHVEYRLSQTLQLTLSGDCCPTCCHTQTCSKTIEYSCTKLIHCNNSLSTCSNGYFVDIDAVYIFKVALPQQIIKRLYTLMLKPIFTEIAESQESAALIWIETERQRNEYLNKARQTLMKALAESELIHEKARIIFDSILLKQLSLSERKFFNRLNVETMVDKLSASFLLELNHLVNVTQTVDVDGLITEYDETIKTQQTNDLYDFVSASNVFDLTEFLSILEN